MAITTRKEAGITYVTLEGRMDSQNASEIEKELLGQMEESTTKIMIDVEQLEYISSAGLRVLLKLRKVCGDIEIVGASQEVYEIFQMTGFTEILHVTKAYRKLSVEGCDILGEGSNGIVYRYDPEIVVKVYRNANALAEIERERMLARKALILGIPTAIPFDIVKVGDSYGSVFELLNAKSFSMLIAEEPEKIDQYIAQFVDLLKKIHGTRVEPEEMQDMRKIAIGWAKDLVGYLPEAESDKLLTLLEAVPECDCLIHGDYHTNNVQMLDGEALLIDMDTLSYGYPIFELAAMFLGFGGFASVDPEEAQSFINLPLETKKYIWKKCLSLYLNTEEQERIEEVEKKAQLIAYARLMRRAIRRIGCDTEKGSRIMKLCQEKVTGVLQEVDSLEY